MFSANNILNNLMLAVRWILVLCVLIFLFLIADYLGLVMHYLYLAYIWTLGLCVIIFLLLIVTTQLYLTFKHIADFISRTIFDVFKPDKFTSYFYAKEDLILINMFYVKSKVSRSSPYLDIEMHKFKGDTIDVFRSIDRFLKIKSNKKIYFLFGDPGMGKTTSVACYYIKNKYKITNKVNNLFLLSLSKESTFYATLDLIDSTMNPDEVNIIIDSLDECSTASIDFENFMEGLFNRVSKYRRVIITCRTQFFDLSIFLNPKFKLLKTGLRPLGSSFASNIEILYLTPFSQFEIFKYIINRFGIINLRLITKILKVVYYLPSLSTRPMVLAYLPQLIQDKKWQFLNSIFGLYLEITDQWLHRESYWVEYPKMHLFSLNCADDIWKNRDERKGEFISLEHANTIAIKNSIQLEKWQIESRSLMNKDELGNFKFSHRTILEFLSVKSYLTTGNVLLFPWTDMMKRFLFDFLTDKDSFSISQVNNFDNENRIINLADLSLYNYVFEFKKMKNIDFINTSFESSILKQLVFENCTFSACSFQNSTIDGHSTPGGKGEAPKKSNIFENCNFKDTNLTSVTFNGAIISNSVFKDCNFHKVKIIESIFENVFFSDVDFAEMEVFETSSFKGCNFQGEV